MGDGHSLYCPLFKYDEPDLSAGIALAVEPQVIAQLGSFKHLNQGDPVSLMATVGWKATPEPSAFYAVVIFGIERVVNGAASVIYTLRDSREFPADAWGDASLDYVDACESGKVTYRLLASLDYNPATGQPYGPATVYQATLTGDVFRH